MNTKITCLLAFIATILLVYVVWDSQGGAGRSSSIGDRKAVTIGLLMLTETIFAPLWVWMFLNEILPSSVFIGGMIIIFAIIVKSLDRNKSIVA